MRTRHIALLAGFGLAAMTSATSFAEDGVTGATLPVITPTVTGTLGSNGWYTSSVKLTWKVASTSTLSAQSGCGAVSVTNNTTGRTYTCTATNQAGTAKKSVTIKRDASAPSATVTAPGNAAVYARGQVVKASYACADTTSGVASCSGTVANGAAIDTATSGSKTFKVTAKDAAGNVATASVNYTVSGTTVVDTTAPVITSTLTGTLGSNGWYRSNVGLTWTISDPQSAISAQSGCSAVTVSTDTAGTTYTCTATSAGGTSTQSVTIKRDATAPLATITAPANAASYSVGQKVTASYACSDAMSSVANCTGPVANGAAIDTATAGTKSFVVNSVDAAGNTGSASVTYTVGSATTPPPTTSSLGTQLFAWNDLGMHCADSDFSVFTLLPPFNNVNAQLVQNGKLVTTGVTMTYEATADPSASVNSFSTGKTNFWTYGPSLFNANQPGIGLTGNPTASYTPAPLSWNPTNSWFEATGIPITPIDDAYRSNAFPMIKVTARDGTGNTVATVNTVLPVSSEINCFTCHSSTGSAAAKPAAGWVASTGNAEKDWRFNVLRLHDEKNVTNVGYAGLLSKKGYGTSLESSAMAGKPILCDTCHNSNALAVWGIAGETGVTSMTSAMHNRHAGVTLPGATQTLGSSGTRDACYNCHPGKNTQCLRGAMGNPVNSAGQHVMECQSCHGSMQAVGNPARTGWLDMPNCQTCHQGGNRATTAGTENTLTHTWTFNTAADTRFATLPNTPATGVSLFRFSTGHGNLQCEACHNSTHAEFPATGNDGLRAIAAQGYVGPIRECTTCHTSMPSTTNGGPHGLHQTGQTWVSGHQSAPKTDCTYCHGATSAGSPLAVIKVAKTLTVEGGSKSFAVGDRVTCWSCHNGPNP